MPKRKVQSKRVRRRTIKKRKPKFGIFGYALKLPQLGLVGWLLVVIGFLLIILSVILIAQGPRQGAAALEPIKKIPTYYNEPLVVSMAHNSLSILPIGGRRVKVEKEDVRYIYKNAYKNTDVIQTEYPYKIKEELVFYSPGHPLKFRYKLGSIEKFVIEEDEEGNIIFYDKVLYEKDKNLARIFTIPTPFVEDKVGKRSFDAVKTVINNNELSFEVDRNWLLRATYPVVLDPTVEINVLNVHSHPEQGEEWVVEFTTSGRADLKIIPNDQATIDDDEFIGLYCDGEQLEPQILDGDVIYYPDWECDGVGKVVHLTLKRNKHVLRFEFGDQVAYAYNGTSDIRVARGTFTSIASPGTDSITGVGFQPKAVMFFGVPQTDESAGSHASWFVGFSDGTTHKSASVESEDAANDTGRSQQNDAINLIDYDGRIRVRATISAFISDGFTVNYETTNSGYVIHYIAFGGDDLEAEVGQDTVSSDPLELNSGTLEPDIIFLITTGYNYETADTNGIISFGVVDDTDQWYIGGTHGTNNLTKSSLLTVDGSNTDACLAQIHSDSKSWEMYDCDLTATGLTWEGTNADQFGYLALDLGNNDTAVGVFTKETTGTDGASEDITGWGFDNDAAIVGFASAGKTDLNLSGHTYFSHGSYDGTNQGVITVTDDESSTNSDSVQNNDYAIGISTSTATIIAGGTASALDDDGVTLTWSPNNSTGFYVGYWAIEGSPPEVNTPTLLETPAFPNMKASTTQPSIGRFFASHPTDGSVQYKFAIDNDYDFSSPATTTKSYNYPSDAGWTAASFAQGSATTTYEMQSGDALSNGTTYWWGVMARDAEGAWTATSTLRSLTIDTSLSVDQWYQTIDEQFDTIDLSDDVVTTSGSIQLSPGGTGSQSFTDAGSDTWEVPLGVTEIIVKAWGAGGGGGGGGSAHVGGDGGGGGFASSTLDISGESTINVHVGGGGGFGTYAGSGAGGGGGGGRSEVSTSTVALVAAGGGAGGGGDNSGGTAQGRPGGAGGGTTGIDGDDSGSSTGGGGGTQVGGGSAGTGPYVGEVGSSQTGGRGANGSGSGTPPYGAEDNAGTTNGGAGGTGTSGGYHGGGGGGAGYYGGGGGGAASGNDNGGSGGGGGSSYLTGTGTATESGSGTSVANSDDDDYIGSVGVGGAGGSTTSSGSPGNDGMIIFFWDQEAATSGTATSTEIDFDWVGSQTSWGEIYWDTTEPVGADVKLRVAYTNVTACDTYVPDGVLSGNDAGFDATASPLDISDLSTETYNKICLEVILTTSGDSPSLNEWYVTWEPPNSTPTISSVDDTPDPVTVGNNVTFSVNWNDEDAGENIKAKICKTDNLTNQNCDDGFWATSTDFTTDDPEELTYTSQADDIATSPNNYYAFVCDDEGACSSSDSGTFTVNAAAAGQDVKGHLKSGIFKIQGGIMKIYLIETKDKVSYAKPEYYKAEERMMEVDLEEDEEES